MPFRIEALLFGVTLVVPSPVARIAVAQSTDPVGRYVLTSVGRYAPPIMVSRVIPGEGTTLQGAWLNLTTGGKLTGEIIVSFTDSATATDTIQLDGRWRLERDTLRFTYHWSAPRFWQGGPRIFHEGHPVAAGLTRSTLTLLELAYFDERMFGTPTPLEFHRAP